MPRGQNKTEKKSSNGATLGFEAKLWLAADKLRNNMDAAEYKHVVLGLIFLKYISDAFEEMRAKLVAGKGDYEGSDPEDADEYKAENVFWVPKEARWPHLQSSAKQSTIGKVVDDAMVALERDNPRIKGVLPKNYARPGLDKHRLGELIDLIGSIQLGDAANRSKDILGRVFEYFLKQFASDEGKNGGQFYTPNCIVRLLVEMLSPYKGRIYDPCCGSGGMFVQSEKFVLANGSMSSNQSGEGDIRKALIDADLVDCTPGVVTKARVSLKTLRGLRSRRPPLNFLLMVTFLRLGVMWGLKKSKMTANPLRKRCNGLLGS